MPKICYQEFNFRKATLDVIQKANEIIEDLKAQGFDLTLRQLFYQFVSKDLIPNTERSYKRLGSIINDARLAGMIDWDAITDRTRKIRKNQHWDSPSEIVEAASRSYRIDKWQNQDHRVEVWVEKDALINVVARACQPLDVTYFSCRGYSSQSAQWRAGQRLLGWERDGQKTIILHLGDHDPSGIDMTRDIQNRLRIFRTKTKVKRIALTMEQVEELNPPPNPTKATDPRGTGYMEEFGDESWELDALEPRYIVDLITKHVLEIRDKARWNEMIAKERGERETLGEAADRLQEEMKATASCECCKGLPDGEGDWCVCGREIDPEEDDEEEDE